MGRVEACDLGPLSNAAYAAGSPVTATRYFSFGDGAGDEAAASYLLLNSQRAEIWDRWKAGESMSSIGRRFDRESWSVLSVLSPTGGIRPPDRRRASRALTGGGMTKVSAAALDVADCLNAPQVIRRAICPPDPKFVNDP